MFFIFSISAPPGYPNPINFATLSNASMASSTLPPNNSIFENSPLSKFVYVHQLMTKLNEGIQFHY